MLCDDRLRLVLLQNETTTFNAEKWELYLCLWDVMLKVFTC